MKFAHISDLHLGKTLYKYSLIEDQQYILEQIVNHLAEKKVEVLLVAGDVFDKNIASVEGIRTFRKFLNNLVEKDIKVLIISGNHDSADRLTFGAEFMTEKGIYFSKVYDGSVEKVVLNDEFGPVNFYLLPFITPSEVKHYFPEEADKIDSYETAVSCAINKMNLNKKERNVIISHQNILNAEHCESEQPIIGGLDAISAEVFKDFEYTALGHIHKFQNLGGNVYFSGTPLKYSVSELNHDKKMPVITLGKKSENSEVTEMSEEEFQIEEIPLVPLRDLRQVTGKFADIISLADNKDYNTDDYLDVILTDENEIMNAMETLRVYYPHILHIDYDNSTTRNDASVEDIAAMESFSPLQMFEEFYKNRMNEELTDEMRSYMEEIIKEVWKEEI